jgi:subtilisin-like proprotein convertase family protein
VDAAVALARNWTHPLGTWQEKEFGGTLANTVSIPDGDAAGITRTLDISETDNLTIENLTVGLKVDHSNTGEIAVELTSPAGTKSILLNLRSALKSGMKDGAVLGSNAFYGEKSQGQWTLRIVDGVTGNTGTLNNFTIKIGGY